MPGMCWILIKTNHLASKESKMETEANYCVRPLALPLLRVEVNLHLQWIPSRSSARSLLRMVAM
jgi:hypothetical protein